jgi:hypothetical protein
MYDLKPELPLHARQNLSGGQVGDKVCPIIAIEIIFLRPLVPAEEPGAAFPRSALERVVRFAVSSACVSKP